MLEMTFFVSQSRTHMSKTFIKHLQTYQLRKGRPNWTFCCRRQTSLRHLQSSPGCRATPTSNTRCWANIFTPADWKMLSVHGRDQYKDIQCILYMPMCQFMECIYTILYYSNKYSQIYIKHNKCVDSNLYLHWRCRLMELRCEQWSQESTGTLSQVLKT